MGDHIFLKVMPKRGVSGLISRESYHRGTLDLSRYSRGYQLVLPLSLSGVHAVFHISILQKYTLDSTHVVDWDGLIVDANGTFEEGPVRIMDSPIKYCDIRS